MLLASTSTPTITTGQTKLVHLLTQLCVRRTHLCMFSPPPPPPEISHGLRCAMQNRCEAGDLSGKFKVFPTNGSSGNGAFSDTYLDTTGTLSVADCVGRSVVIHNVYPNPPASSRNRECANITGNRVTWGQGCLIKQISQRAAVTTPTSAPTGGSQAVMDGGEMTWDEV